MSPDDPRHGTTAGYNQGCRDTCCKKAIADWTRHRRTRLYLQGALTVPSVGTRRRIQALMALGWSGAIMEARLGKKRTYIAAILGGGSQPVLRSTAEAIAKLYDELSMSLPPQATHRERQSASRARNYAHRMGWPPPLAWDDIDNDPRPVSAPRSPRGIDEAVVERVLAGEHLPTSRAEKDEITRRWRATGRPTNDLERLFGWKPDRYDRRTA